MNRRHLLLNLALLPCLAARVPLAATVREPRAVTGFSALEIDGIGDVLLHQGAPESLVVEAESAVLPRVRHRVRNGVLRIWLEGAVQTKEPLRYHIGMQAIHSVTLQGSVSLRASPMQTPRFDLRLEGSGNADIARIEARHVGIVLTGAGVVTIAGGSAQSQSIALAGAGDYHAERMASRSARVDISGSGNVTLAAAERLEAAISGSGDIAYRGRPQVKETISGSGGVSRLD